jgi:hypothetical protein
MAMSHPRWQQLHQGLSSIAKKVYRCVPISEPWDAKQVFNEVKRQGSSLDFTLL